MDDFLLQRVKDITPKFNDSIANGLAVEHLKRAMAYIDRLFVAARDQLPAGLVYEGSRVCTPIEQFRILTQEYNSKRIANIARFDTYMVRYEFSYNGEPLDPRHVLMPFVRDGGLITLNGALYNIAPVLTDVGFSVLRGGIFIPFRRTRLNFNRTDYHFFANGTRDIIYVIHSMVHNNIQKVTKRDLDARREIHSCLAHYFFAKFGVRGTFRKWAGTEVQLGWLHEFPEKDYPRSQYIVYQSAHLYGKHPTDQFCLVIPKSAESMFVRMLVGGFFYVADTFPDQFYDAEEIDSTTHWRILLGRIAFGDFESAGRLLENIETHMASFDTYLDEITREELKDRNIYVDTIYELLYVIMTDLAHYFYQTSSDDASMYNKRLMVLRYVMEEFNSAISKFGFAFQSQPDKNWTVSELNDALKNAFKVNTCIKALTSTHGEINTVSYPGDNKIFRITSMLIPQDKAKRKRGYTKGLINDNSRLLHASIAEVGQYCNLPKNNPDGRSRINPPVSIETDGMIRPDPDKRELIQSVQRRLVR